MLVVLELLNFAPTQKVIHRLLEGDGFESFNLGGALCLDGISAIKNALASSAISFRRLSRAYPRRYAASALSLILWGETSARAAFHHFGE
jgi:hypothetical protein